MKPLLRFLAVGSAFATLGEFLFCVMVRGSLRDYAFTLVAYPVLLVPAYALSRTVDRLVRRPAAADLVYNLVSGSAGLLIEWFLIGNSPWRNPDADQVGMFAYWAVVFTMPRMCVAQRPALRGWRRSAALFYAAFAMFSVWVGAISPPELRRFALVWLVVVGYAALEILIGAAILFAARRDSLLTNHGASPIA
jgi:hypothetical protein